MKRILIAPNAFKHALAADAAAEAIARGIRAQHPEMPLELFPVADGGDGTARIFHLHGKGEWREAGTMDPLGRSITAGYTVIDTGKTAVVDMAAASGIALLKDGERDPLRANSYGTGLLIKDALDRGVEKLLLGVGGTATNDGGTGILRALGMRFLDGEGGEIIDPGRLEYLERVDDSAVDGRLDKVECIVLCDVVNPLLGIEGATRVFGPQKGVRAENMEQLEKGLEALARVSKSQWGKDIGTMPHGGAAGGAAAGLFSGIRARLVSGISYFLEATGFEAALQRSGLVITGEGSMDAQTLQGKAPWGVAEMARRHGVPVIGLAGRISDEEMLRPWFSRLVNINSDVATLDEMLSRTEENLERVGRELVG